MPNHNDGDYHDRAYPTAIHAGMALGNLRLIAAMNDLIDSFRVKSRAFDLIARMPTPVQSEGPMTLGQAFTAFAETLTGEVRALEAAQRVLWEDTLEAATIEATQDMHMFVHYSACMKGLATTLSKICIDLRLLSSDPRPGGQAITSPPSPSNVPGEATPLMSPIAARIFEAQTMLIDAVDTLRFACVEDITAKPEVRRYGGGDSMKMTRRSIRRSGPGPQAS